MEWSLSHFFTGNGLNGLIWKKKNVETEMTSFSMSDKCEPLRKELLTISRGKAFIPKLN